MRLELRQVALAYDGRAPLFGPVDLCVEDGDFLIIEGPSGSGKSSLLRLLNGLHSPSSGEVVADGVPFGEQPITELRRRIACLQQTPVMLEGSVRDNLLLPFCFAANAGLPVSDDASLRARLDELKLERVALDHDAETLSVGQQQRVAFLRTLLVSPAILLCDEPTSALDSESRDVVEGHLESACAEQGIGIVLVTHLPFACTRIQPRRYRLVPGETSASLEPNDAGH